MLTILSLKPQQFRSHVMLIVCWLILLTGLSPRSGRMD